MKRILIIDDDPDIRTVMSHFLKKNGYEVETASNRDEALQTIQRLNPSVILLDVLLSGSDGRDLCKEIKATPGIKETRVIIFSAHPGAGDKISEYGADDFIPKPFNTELLLKKVENQFAFN